MPFSEEMGRIIMEGGNAMNIAEQAQKEGVKDLRQSALRKVLACKIDLAQANACTVGD
jgi:type IV pilus assembly protein PilB